MEDIEYLLDRIAFLEDRLAHLESKLMPLKDTSRTNLLELYKQIQEAKTKSTVKIHNGGVLPCSLTSISTNESYEKLHKSFREYYNSHIRGDL
jgi:hypothetical protein